MATGFIMKHSEEMNFDTVQNVKEMSRVKTKGREKD